MFGPHQTTGPRSHHLLNWTCLPGDQIMKTYKFTTQHTLSYIYIVSTIYILCTYLVTQVEYRHSISNFIQRDSITINWKQTPKKNEGVILCAYGNENILFQKLG